MTRTCMTRTGLSAKGVVVVLDEEQNEKLVKCASDNDMEERYWITHTHETCA